MRSRNLNERVYPHPHLDHGPQDAALVSRSTPATTEGSAQICFLPPWSAGFPQPERLIDRKSWPGACRRLCVRILACAE